MIQTHRSQIKTRLVFWIATYLLGAVLFLIVSLALKPEGIDPVHYYDYYIGFGLVFWPFASVYTLVQGGADLGLPLYVLVVSSIIAFIVSVFFFFWTIATWLRRPAARVDEQPPIPEPGRRLNALRWVHNATTIVNILLTSFFIFMSLQNPGEFAGSGAFLIYGVILIILIVLLIFVSVLPSITVQPGTLGTARRKVFFLTALELIWLLAQVLRITQAIEFL